MSILFDAIETKDIGLEKFVHIVDGHWEPESKKPAFIFAVDSKAFDIGGLTSFLLLTRLQDDQIVALATQDNRYRLFAQKLDLLADASVVPLLSITQVRNFIFERIDRKKISLRKISEATGLSQVALSNFKAGGDIRLTNLLKIAKALDVVVTLSA